MIESSARTKVRRIACGMSVTLLVAFAGLVWSNAFASGLLSGVFVAVSALTIALFAATRSGAWRRARTAALSSLAWWLGLSLVGGLVTLLKSGSFDEGGPVGFVLVVGVYLGLPIAFLAIVATVLAGQRVGAER